MWQLQSGAIWLKQCSGNHVILSRLQIPRRQNREQFHLKRSLCRISITPLLRWTRKGDERWRGEGFGRLPKKLYRLILRPTCYLLANPSKKISGLLKGSPSHPSLRVQLWFKTLGSSSPACKERSARSLSLSAVSGN